MSELNHLNFLFQGLISDFGGSEYIIVDRGTFEAQSAGSSSWWWVILPLLVICSLSGTVVYLWQRHRRLQSSFSRFVNTHYDTKTGATRLGGGLDDDDHDHHNDAVRSFADDEPLVVT